MSQETGYKTLMSYRKVFQDDVLEIGLRYDLGVWTVESREKRNDRVSHAAFTPELMDQIVAAWPAMKASVDQ